MNNIGSQTEWEVFKSLGLLKYYFYKGDQKG